ncbi:hypothetical protein SAMN06265219_10738 [Gracilimonas mengyeensis]|uniref:NnrS protein n=2 Tax=Gracilimonas mengyeensis TaxID=1302730 RepID=A0A521D1L2_9BACT|nr:hypothetical protein SAMN06265219_10738 [Gracilimonas mengyeensis]
MVFAALGLLTGLYAGLAKLGFLEDVNVNIPGGIHGPLMINAFLGTLIGLERAAALEKRWTLSGPFLMALSVVFMLFVNLPYGSWLFTTGSFFITLTLLYICFIQPKIYHYIMAMGSTALFIGNLLFAMGAPVFEVVIWWLGFPVLTIFGERLELNRIMRPPKKAQWAFVAFIFMWVLGTVLLHVNRVHGWHLVMVATLASALWLIKYDIARRTIKSVQWTRYSAWCLISGFGWLILTAVFGLIYGLPTAGPIYDALLHMVFVGFVFSMIFAHASVIIPSLSGKIIPWSRYFYLPLVLLHGSLFIRIAGDFLGLYEIRSIGSWINVLAILMFLIGIWVLIFKKNES